MSLTAFMASFALAFGLLAFQDLIFSETKMLYALGGRFSFGALPDNEEQSVSLMTSRSMYARLTSLRVGALACCLGSRSYQRRSIKYCVENGQIDLLEEALGILRSRYLKVEIRSTEAIDGRSTSARNSFERVLYKARRVVETPLKSRIT